MRRNLQFATVLVLSMGTCGMNAQLPDGTIAPDWTFKDITGKSWHLYELCDKGQTVVFDIFATWCGPCFDYHTGGELEKFYNAFGAPGTKQAAPEFDT